MKAMIFAAGLGTRLRPYTNDRPKALVEVGGRTLLEIQILRLKKLGFKDFVVNIHHFADLMIGYLGANDNFGVNIEISDERNELLETGGGLKKARPLLDGSGPVYICNVDILTDLDPWQMLKKHEESGALATLAVRNRPTSRYLLFDHENRLRGWKNIKTNELKGEDRIEFNRLAFSGMQIISPDFFKHLTQDGKFSVIDTYLSVCGDHPVLGYRHDHDIWLDVGKPEALPQAAQLLGQVL